MDLGTYDYVVVGAGIVGAASALELSKQATKARSTKKMHLLVIKLDATAALFILAIITHQAVKRPSFVVKVCLEQSTFAR